ncbi:hypothetical protein BDR04DRAFT_1226546 [Suillus decipiens]|nr:hypothetical protein BDR04DRAFT_1226546 [Suillus decipiens]
MRMSLLDIASHRVGDGLWDAQLESDSAGPNAVFSSTMLARLSGLGLQFALVFLCHASALRSFSLQPNATGYALFFGGLTVEFCNLLCGLCVGVAGSTAALADAADLTPFVKVLVIEVFGSVLGLFGLIIVLLIIGNAKEFLPGSPAVSAIRI